MQEGKTIVHDEYISLCDRMNEYPSDHSDVVYAMKSRIEAELAKLPRAKAVPYRRRSSAPPPTDAGERRMTTRVSATGLMTMMSGGVTAASKRALAYPEEEEEEGEEEDEEEIRHPVYPQLNAKQDATLDRLNMERDVKRYHHILNQAVGIQQTALSHIATIVHQLD